MDKRYKVFLFLILLLVPSILISGCTKQTKTSKQAQNSDFNTAGSVTKSDGFLGDKGDKIEAEDGKILIAESKVEDGNMHSFNYFSEKLNKNIYFFIIKASDGTYRVAANACEVCYGAKKGFSQQGNLIRCDNCRVTYPKDRIAMEKGGCNPGPIDKDAAVEDGQLIINVDDVEAVGYLF